MEKYLELLKLEEELYRVRKELIVLTVDNRVYGPSERRDIKLNGVIEYYTELYELICDLKVDLGLKYY